MQHAEVRCESAQERTDGEDGHATHIEALAANDRRKPATQGQDDRIRDEVGSQDPGAFVSAGGKISGNVR